MADVARGLALILHFDQPDVHQPQPWPVAVDPENVVQSGLGDDDGARLLGFGPAGEQRITVQPGVARLAPDAVVGMTATFSNEGGLFLWNIPIGSVEVKEVA